MVEPNLADIIRYMSRVTRNFNSDPGLAVLELWEIADLIDRSLPYHNGHHHRVGEYSKLIGQRLGLTHKEITICEIAALLHDFGKMAVSDKTLSKKEVLTDTEKAELQSHALKGYYMLEGLIDMDDVLISIRNHHEHFTGSGYPEGLTGDNIPLNSRIIAVADAYDAMTSERPYRKTLEKDKAIDELIIHSGIQFDPKIVIVFLKTIV
jgi:HD-GYP domain-containing protein (c-di-GMP phosphodiesterase class II)